MKIRYLLLTFVALLSIAAAQAESKSTITKTIASLNAQAKGEGGAANVLKTISKNTGIPVGKLESQKSRSGLTYGELYIANAIAKSSGKSFEQVAAMKTGGKSWDQVADENNVSLGGEKKTAKPAANQATATPKPREMSAREKYEAKQREMMGGGASKSSDE